MRLGFAVKVLGGGGMPSHDARRWQSRPHLRVSLAYLRDIFDYLKRVDLDMYRMSSSLAPYATHPDMPQFRGQLEECLDELADLGTRAREQDLRLSMHPGQYVVLNSDDERVRELALADVEAQAAIFDAMGLGPEAVVVVHVGGASGGVSAGLTRFERGFERLSERARSRLVIENDDRTFALADVLELSARTGAPVVWDILHHHCHDPAGIPHREALARACETWPAGVLPKIHYSSPKTSMEEHRRREGRRVIRTWALPQLRAHADMVDPIAFEHFLGRTPAGQGLARACQRLPVRDPGRVVTVVVQDVPHDRSARARRELEHVGQGKRAVVVLDHQARSGALRQPLEATLEPREPG